MRARRTRLLLRHRRLLTKAVILLAYFRISLLLTSYVKISTQIVVVSQEPPNPLQPALLAWATTVASSVVPNATCLAQALTLQKLLAAQGQIAIIRVGVKGEPSGAVSAHAWVMHCGEVLLGGVGHDLDLYAKIADLEPLKQ